MAWPLCVDEIRRVGRRVAGEGVRYRFRCRIEALRREHSYPQLIAVDVTNGDADEVACRRGLR
jgi:hypothetical protein